MLSREDFMKGIGNVIKAKGNGDNEEEQELRLYKRVILPVSPEIFFSFARKGDRHISVDPGLPPDTKFVGAFYNYKDHNFSFVVESEEFEAILEGETLPIMDSPTIQEYDCPYVGEAGAGLSDLSLRVLGVHHLFEDLEKHLLEKTEYEVDLSEFSEKVKNLMWRKVVDVDEKETTGEGTSEHGANSAE